jgi:hypothetical protein
VVGVLLAHPARAKMVAMRFPVIRLRHLAAGAVLTAAPPRQVATQLAQWLRGLGGLVIVVLVAVRLQRQVRRLETEQTAAVVVAVKTLLGT